MGGLSQNAAFSTLTAWGLRLAGLPVAHFVCESGMSRCVLGTNRDDHTKPPPCKTCIAQSRRLYTDAETTWFSYLESGELVTALRGLDLDALIQFEHQGWSHGQLVLPSLRWALRRHHLNDDKPTRFLMREFILSAHNIAREFSLFLDQKTPRAVIIFNGMMFPEAVAHRLAEKKGIPVISHEVAFQPLSAFFTQGEATAYPIDIPENFELSAKQNNQLDEYLQQRIQGNFTMAGIRFWPKMRGLDEELLSKIEDFDQFVPIFSNVIFDTSQVHANTLFSHMFEWLDHCLELIKAHPETLFVIRAHPDEMRPGTKKQSRESVRQWVDDNNLADLPNVVFIDSQEYISSYALIQHAKFIMVYNSSIGLEAALMGSAVLCAGRARYTQYPTVFYPDTPLDYITQVHEFLSSDHIEVPEEFMYHARRFMYFQLFRTALPYEKYLMAHPRPGYTRLKSFELEDLLPANSTAIDVIYEGVVNDTPFLV